MRTRKYAGVIRTKPCTCGKGEVFVFMAGDRTMGGAILNASLRTTQCKKCKKNGGTWPMTDEEVVVAQKKIEEWEKAKAIIQGRNKN